MQVKASAEMGKGQAFQDGEKINRDFVHHSSLSSPTRAWPGRPVSS